MLKFGVGAILKNRIFSTRPPTCDFFSKKEGLIFSADRPTGSSYWPWWVESKGAAGILM